MNLKISSLEKYSILTTLFSYPILSLVVRGWVSGLFFVLLAFSVFLLARSRILFDKSTWDTHTVLFVIAMASSAFAIMLSQIYHQDFRATPYDEASRLLFAVPIYLALRVGNLKITNALQYAFPLGAITAFAVVGLNPLDSGHERSSSYFLNVIHFGDLALMLGFLSLFSINLDQKSSFLSPLLKLVGLIAGLYLSFRSGTRGGWLAIPVLCVIWILYINNSTKLRTRNMATLGLVAFVGVVGYYFHDMIHQRIIETYSDLSAFINGNRDTSIGLRIQIFKAAMLLLKENPLFGVGLEGYKQMIPMLSRSGIISPLAAELGLAEVHNQILNYSVKYGVFGLISGIAIYLVPFVIFTQSLRSSVGEKRVAGLMGICLVTGFFIFGLTVEIFNLKNTITFYSLTLASLLAAIANNSNEPQHGLRSENNAENN